MSAMKLRIEGGLVLGRRIGITLVDSVASPALGQMDTHLVNQRGAQLWHVAFPWAPYRYAEKSGSSTAYRLPSSRLETRGFAQGLHLLIIRARVLRSGDRLALADIVTQVQLQHGIVCNSARTRKALKSWPRSLRRSVVIATARDGYKAVFSWAELYLSPIGDGGADRAARRCAVARQ